jgi:hypothetical protein
VFGFLCGAIYREPGSHLQERTLRVIETVVITSRDQLSFWPRPFEVKREAKMGEKYGKIRKIGYLIEFYKRFGTLLN